MKKLVELFKILNREQILALPAGKYKDYELLSVCKYLMKSMTVTGRWRFMN
jgi:hypothetical protein